MLVLMGFALVAGAATAITPCVLPVLPALLSASAVGGRRRPVGIALGLALTFTVTIVGLASVIDGVGVADGTARSLGIAVLLGFGLMLLWPRLAQRVEAPLYRLTRFGPRSRGDGFWSGMVVGGLCCTSRINPVRQTIQFHADAFVGSGFDANVHKRPVRPGSGQLIDCHSRPGFASADAAGLDADSVAHHLEQ